ncbi:RNA polymerase sigma factor [Alkalihalobacterium bogoriense]|uniref:RNA polymerase sigma factor n=1 Tax=Alkalihalobacterium bogoriense TaxID=246272 RepID=UPI00047D6C09|nr:RNA polymerase sigma factor [Alkalihalobacterium bogoriense]
MGLYKDKRQFVMGLYETYYDDVYRFILYMLGDKQCCEDLVHDTFVRVFMAYDRFDNQSNVKTWLFGIAKHLVIDEIRKRKRRRFISFVKEIPSPINVEQNFENKEAVSYLIESIQKLKPNYRVVIILKKVEECSTRQIGEILGWSETKVRKTLSRALQSLRRMKAIEEGGDRIEQTL